MVLFNKLFFFYVYEIKVTVSGDTPNVEQLRQLSASFQEARWEHTDLFLLVFGIQLL